MTRNRVLYGRFLLTSNGPVTLLQRTYTLVDLDSPRHPEAKRALQDAQRPEYRVRGDVAHVAQDLLQDRHGMDQVQAAKELGAVWREAVMRHPVAYTRMVGENVAYLFLPKPETMAQRYEQLLRQRWPPAWVEEAGARGFFQRVRRVLQVGAALETGIAWLSLIGMSLALGSATLAFVLACYLGLWLAVAASAVDYRYYFELQPFQTVFAGLALAKLTALRWDRRTGR